MATSTAAEDERPEPTGTSLLRAMFMPESAYPASCSAQATPTLVVAPTVRIVRRRCDRDRSEVREPKSAATMRTCRSARGVDRHHGVSVDCRGQHKAVVIVGVLADQIHAAWRDDEQRRWRAKGLCKRCGGPFL